ncbi:MAG: hypothetical protein M1831_003332 [Alyxoria varia]|nr:MAG: hypothetical protein M1831_003332 [Alyxoria varia]
MASPRSLEGKIAIVTGSSRGIGAAIAENLASKGAHVLINYTSDSSGPKTQTLASRLSSTHSIKAIPVQADLGSTTAPSTIIKAAKTNFGENFTVHIIINNAGVAALEPLGKPITPESFHRVFDVNVLGPILLVQELLPHLPNDRSGRIVNVSSVSATLGFAEQSTYGGSKAALEAMTRTWSRELAERATVNSINPGPVDTDMYGSNDQKFYDVVKPFNQNTPLAQVSREKNGDEVYERENPKGGRAATSEEIAGVVGMLCSAESGWCTGSLVCANGGFRFSV